MIRAFFKGLLLSSVILCMAVHSLFETLLTRDPLVLRRARARLLSQYSRLALSVLGIRVREMYRIRPPGPTSDIGRLIVCNHLSYLDVLVIASVYPAVFVTSVEVRRTFFLGQMALLGGSLFVERRSRAGIGSESAEISRALAQGLDVVLFPEATSSNGEGVLPFRRAFFGSAVDAESDVLMLCMKYASANGQPVDASNRDSVYYYGDLSFFPQLCSMLRLKQVVVELRTLEMAPHRDDATKELLCERAYSVIAGSYGYPEYQSSRA